MHQSTNGYDDFCCPNIACSEYNQPNKDGHIILYTRYGKKQVRLLQCTACNKTFSELVGTPFWDSRLDWDTIAAIYRILIHGENGSLVGIRATATRLKLSKNTVKRYWRFTRQGAPQLKAVKQFLIEKKIITDDLEGNETLLQAMKRHR